MGEKKKKGCLVGRREFFTKKSFWTHKLYKKNTTFRDKFELKIDVLSVISLN